MTDFIHYSVLKNESIDGLNIKPNGVYVDGTCGGGGHSMEIANRLSDNGRLICIDRDEEAIAATQNKIGDRGNVTYVHDNFKNLKSVLSNLKIEKIDGILIDLGVSSYQLDNRSRGFSYLGDEDLDMRMDRSQALSAKDVINSYEEKDLAQIFKEYGEERYAKKIASSIVKARAEKPIQTTGELNEIIFKCVPQNAPGGHPSKRVFMALRIEVNEELGGLGDYIYELPDLMNKEGRICIISFHSLEDRIVKESFKKAFDPCICPKNFPVCTCGRVSKGKIVTRKPILPGTKELEENSRSKSAKLRIFEA